MAIYLAREPVPKPTAESVGGTRCPRRVGISERFRGCFASALSAILLPSSSEKPIHLVDSSHA